MALIYKRKVGDSILFQNKANGQRLWMTIKDVRLGNVELAFDDPLHPEHSYHIVRTETLKPSEN